MKKTKFFPILPILMIAILLSGNVGLHLFHQHEADSKSAIIKVFSNVGESQLDVLEEECPLCKIDSFHSWAVLSEFNVEFQLLLNGTYCSTKNEVTFSECIFSCGRAPPIFS